ncbi:putative late blight resistance protein homolog R1B-16 [Silene latifolia]|uniref:putative late blight resistance protein homolog R1B-16 n=1 Tax=Silene latifolia TaxID=37657 RepID=UPI003D778B32
MKSPSMIDSCCRVDVLEDCLNEHNLEPSHLDPLEVCPTNKEGNEGDLVLRVDVKGHLGEDDSRENEFEDQINDEIESFLSSPDSFVLSSFEGSQLVQVISIVGMPGSGKTTLAMKVYKIVARSFHCSAWCYVSQNYENKGLIQQIINDIEGPREDTEDLSEEDLALKLYQVLMKKKDYLIVLDDVWDIQVWNQLRMCFPLGNNRNKILLTSRSKVVGLHAATSDDSCIGLNLISPEKGRILLEKRVFGGKSFPEHLRDIGMKITDKCGGLPLSLVLIAGVLKNIEQKEQEWEKVSKNLDSFVKNQDDILDKLELSYKHLPIHLKQCFLYCGALSVEEAAESCLMDLISRSLLIVVKRGSDGQVRTCRVHDLLRDFCIWKGHEEQFLLTRIDTLKAFPNWPRRICICLHKLVDVKYPPWS